MSDLNDLQKRIIAFRDAREWKQFHNPKDMAISLVMEATEVLEHFQWMNQKEMSAYVNTHKPEIAEELADTLHCLLIMAHDLEIDLVASAQNKIKKNEAKYPVEKARGNHTKYTEHQKESTRAVK